jgi:anti-anti-sigma factor
MGESASLAIYRTESGYFLRVVGRGTMRESPAVRDFVEGAVQNGADIVLDLSACEYLDSTFLGCLVILQQRSRNNDGSFAVLADESAQRKLLRTAGLHHLLTFADERPQSIGEPVELQASNLQRHDFCRHLLEAHRKLADLGGPTADEFRGVAEQLAKELDDASH